MAGGPAPEAPIRRRTASEIASSSTASAAAPVVSSLLIRWKTYSDATSVLNGMLPAMRITAPNSPIARANASATPDSSAGRKTGKMIRRKMVKRPAPSDAAASSISLSSSISTGCTVRTTNGSVTNSSAASTPARVYAMFTWSPLVGPYSARSVRPATIVGSANGRSMTELTSFLPRKSSRTSVHASAVPKNALIDDDAGRERQRQLERRPRLRVPGDLPEVPPAALGRLRDERREGDEDDDAEVAEREPARQRRSAEGATPRPRHPCGDVNQWRLPVPARSSR